MKKLENLYKNNWVNILLIIFVGITLRIPLYHTPYWRTNDTMEYINVARNIVEGRGLTQSIKFHLYDPSPVISSALRSRPPLTSLILAGILKISNDLYHLQIFNLLLGVLNAVLVYVLARCFFKPTICLIGGLLAATNPNILITGRLVLSDQLFATVPLLAAIVFYGIKQERLKAILLGILCGFLVLTRLEGFALLVIFVIYFRRNLKILIVLILSFLVISTPFFIVNWTINGSPVFSKNYIHYRVFDVREALENGFERQFPTSYQFVSQNFSWVFNKIAQTSFLNFSSLMELDYFGPLIILVVLSLRKYSRRYWPWLIFCLSVMCLYNTLWSSTFERSRHFIFVYLLLLLPALHFLQSKTNSSAKFIIILTLVIYFAMDLHRIQWAREVDSKIGIWNPPAFTSEYTWIRENTQIDDIIATTNPFMINMQTRRPTITIPTNLSPENIARFVGQYKVAYFFLPKGDRPDLAWINSPPVANFYDGKIYSVKK